MKIICSKSQLDTAINHVQKAVSVRSTLSLLDSILFVAKNNEVHLTGYDLETGIEVKFEADVIQEGEILLNAKMIAEIVKKLPEETISISSDSQFTTIISSGNSQFNVKGLDASDYPQLPEIDANEKLTIPQSMFKDMISQTIFAVSTDESRPAFNGALLNSNSNVVELVAIDGFRLAVRVEELDYDIPDVKILIPGKALKNIQSILGESGNLELYTTQNHIKVNVGEVTLISRLIQQDFMDYKKILPNTYSTKIEINTKDFYHAVERADLILPNQDRRYPMSLKFTGAQIMNVTATTNVGNMEDGVELNYFDGDELEIDFNQRYFLDALKVISDENVIVEFNGPVGPCIIQPVEGNYFTYLILPLRR